MKKYIDWHTHTTFSDGLDSPDTVVRNSRLKGIESLAITDHDTLAGYWEALEEANKWKVELVPGVEISTEIYHILGLGIEPENKIFNEFLKKVRGLQEKVCEQRIDILQRKGFPVSIDKMKKFFPHPQQRLGKYNLFETLLMDLDCYNLVIQRYKNLSPEEQFREILGNNGLVGKIPNINYVTSSQAIQEIHAAGGLAIVAHPFKQAISPIDLDVLFQEGLDGLEVQPGFGVKNDPYIDYAKSKNIPMSYGSDYHGSSFSRLLLTSRELNYNNLIDVEEFLKNGKH
jgi:3',5'-nucleoside bisphosphate phosphatase